MAPPTDLWFGFVFVVVVGYGAALTYTFTREILTAVWKRWRS